MLSPSLFRIPFLLPFLLSPPLPEAAPWKSAMGLGELYNFPQWGPGQSSGRIRILVYFELENRTWRQHFFYKCPKKKTAVLASAGTTFKNLRQQKISGGGI